MAIVTKIQGLCSDDFRGKCGEPWGFGAVVIGCSRYGEYNDRYGVYQKQLTKKGLKLSRHIDNFPTCPRTPAQLVYFNLFKQAVNAWKALDTQTKQEYNARVYPRHWYGINHFISEYIKSHS